MSVWQEFPKRAVAGAALAVALAAVGPVQAASGGKTAIARVTGHVSASPYQGTAVLLLSDLIVNVAGIVSYDAQGEAINTVLSLNVQPGAVVDLISWNLAVSTVGESWLSEASVSIVNSGGEGVLFSPGFGDDFSGTGTYADGGSLAALGLSFSVLGDGKLFFEFYEDYDDNPGSADAHYLAGNITLGSIAAAVPEPSTYGLMGLGLLGVAFAAQRRRRD